MSASPPRDRPRTPALHDTAPVVLAWYLRYRYRILFVTLLATLVVAPLRQVLGRESGVLELFIALNLVAAASGISGRPLVRRILLGVAAVIVVVSFLGARLASPGLATAADLAWVCFAVLAGVAAVRYALTATAVDGEHVSAALSGYLLAGLIFAVSYLLVDHAWPGAFADAGATEAKGLTLDTAIYFSYVTLATLGYGDVVPRDATARGLAIVEALGAQLYLTVTVARLVALRAQSTRSPDSGGKGDAP